MWEKRRRRREEGEGKEYENGRKMRGRKLSNEKAEDNE